jgi:hydroxyacylglutathione hydrolase
MKIRLKIFLAAPVGIAALLGALGFAATQSRAKSLKAANFEVRTFSISYNDAHLLLVGDKAVLVDTGIEKNAEALDKAIQKSGFDPKKLTAILITHGHADHAGGALYFKEKYNTPIIAGEGDVAMLASGKNDELCPIGIMALLRKRSDQALPFSPLKPDFAISGTVNLKAQFGIDAEVTEVPGHTAGSLVMTFGDVAFVGDMFRGSMISAKATRHFYMCDVPDNQTDIKALLQNIAPKAETFFMGHFSSVSRGSVQILANKKVRQ